MNKLYADRDRAREALDMLKRYCPQDGVIYGTVRHVSQSGMSRRIDFYTVYDGEIVYLTGYMHAIGYGVGKLTHGTKGGIRVDGCGMDMVAEIVMRLSTRLYGDRYYLKYRTL